MYTLSGILIFIIIIIIIVYLLGVLGYHIFLNSTWIDSFFNAAVNITTLNLEVKPVTSTEKVFITVYSLIAITLYLIFIAVLIAVILEPIVWKIVMEGHQYQK